MKKNVFITGASGNLGKAAVEKFLTEGHRVIARFTVTGEIETVEADLTTRIAS